MKHRFFAVAAVIAATFCVSLGLAGCKPETPAETPHEHTFSDWLSNEQRHWRECTICHQELTGSAHSFDNVTGYEYPAYQRTATQNLPILHATAPEGKEEELGEIYIREAWVCLTPKEGATLRVAYSTGVGGTFASYADVSADKGGWVKVTFPQALRLKTYSYFRLQALEDNITVREIVIFGSDKEGKAEPFLMELANVGDSNKGQEGERRKGLIDMQQLPNEKRECTVCGYPEPKAE